jgi:predicted NACHT family NTPase
MCRLFDESDEFPKSRAELYEACIWGILTREWKTPRSEDEPYLHAKLRLVEEIAYRLFIAEKELFYLDELLDLVEGVFQDQPRLEQNLQNKSPSALISELQRDGLLIKAGAGVNPPFLFLHLTFQEYLAARALARRTKMLELDGQEVPEWLKLVKPHFFEPRWEEVIRLLASKLEDATPLVQAIWDEPEDLFLDRLFLAGKCLADARHVEKDLQDKIIKEVFARLERLELTEIRELLARLVGILAARYVELFQKLVSMLKEGEK